MSQAALPHRSIAAVLSLACIALAAYFAVQLVWLTLSEDPAAVPLPAPPMIALAPVSNAIAGLNLFGESAQAQAQAVEEIINAPLTALKLRLSGTVADPAGLEGMAVIIDESGRAARYMIGDALPGGATLKRVLWDRVVLDRLGQQELLKLPRLGETASAAPAAGSTAGMALPTPVAGFPSSNLTNLAPPTLPATPAAATWEQTMQSQQVDFDQIKTMVNAQAVEENGRTVGFTLGAGADPGFLARLGLAPTDVVLSINGQGLSDPTQTLTILTGLQNATSAKVRIRRLGVEQDLLINLSQ